MVDTFMFFTKTKLTFSLALFLGISTFATSAFSFEDTKSYPVPVTVSNEIAPLVATHDIKLWQQTPKTKEELQKLCDDYHATDGKEALAFLEKHNVTMHEDFVDGVRTYTLTPKDENYDKDLVLLYLHGGGYILGGGLTGLNEPGLMASLGKLKVVCVDYRMAPKYPYPAAMDDAMTVYKHLLKKYKASQIGVFGTSTGGGMTLVVGLRAKQDNLPMPGAFGAGTPWSDMTKTGDSYYTNEGVDNVLWTYDGLLEIAAKSYAGNKPLNDPMLSPVYGDVANFPPTFLITGTRDLFLSNTIRMDQRLREVGVETKLVVLEGLSHASYYFVDNAPETKTYYKELSSFFKKQLHK